MKIRGNWWAFVGAVALLIQINSAFAEDGFYYGIWPYDGAAGWPVDFTKYVFAETRAEICNLRAYEMRETSPYKPGTDWCASIQELWLGLDGSNSCTIRYRHQYVGACGSASQEFTYSFFSPRYATCDQINQVLPHQAPKPYDVCGGYFVDALPQLQPQCDSCDQNSIAHPINPATGTMFDRIDDYSSTGISLKFRRSYNSSDAGSVEVGAGWRHAYSRKVIVRNTAVVIRPYVASASTSSQYLEVATACTAGFSEIQGQVPQWAGAVASYTGGNCQLTVGGVSIGSLTIYSNKDRAPPAAQPVAYDVVRDDGQLIRFTVASGVIASPPGIALRLTKTADGFTLTDTSNAMEQYDTNGKLLSVTTRSGGVQTMSYDAAGRLSTAADSFGHQLTFTYDAQGRLSAVTQQ